MREVIFKDLTSLSTRKKDTFLKEVFEKDGMIAKTERRCFYFVKEIADLDEGSELQKWLDRKDTAHVAGQRHFHILKEHNDELGEDKLICKISGIFYAVVGERVYTIAFLHSFKVRFMKMTLAK